MIDQRFFGGGHIIGPIFKDGGQPIQPFIPAAQLARGLAAAHGQHFTHEADKVGGQIQRQIQRRQHVVHLIRISRDQVLQVSSLNQLGQRVGLLRRAQFLRQAAQQFLHRGVDQLGPWKIFALTARHVLRHPRQVNLVAKGIIVLRGPQLRNLITSRNPAAMHARADDGRALALLNHADQARPENLGILGAQHFAARIDFGAPQTAPISAA